MNRAGGPSRESRGCAVPLCGEAKRERIRKLAEELDGHRKRMQAQPGLPLTGLYNVLEKLRSAESPVAAVCDRRSAATNKDGAHRAPLQLTAKEGLIHDQGLVSVLKQLHDDLDATVFATLPLEAVLAAME